LTTVYCILITDGSRQLSVDKMEENFLMLENCIFICVKRTRSIWKMLGPFATTSRLAPIHQVSPLYCRTPPAHRCPRRQRRRQRQRVTEGTAMAPWNGPNQVQRRVTSFMRRTTIPPLRQTHTRTQRMARSTVTFPDAQRHRPLLLDVRVNNWAQPRVSKWNWTRDAATKPFTCAPGHPSLLMLKLR